MRAAAMEHEVDLVRGRWCDMHFPIACFNDDLADADAVWVQDEHANPSLGERVFLRLSDLDELRFGAANHFHTRITSMGVVGSNSEGFTALLGAAGLPLRIRSAGH